VDEEAPRKYAGSTSELSLSRWRQQFIEGAPKIYKNGLFAKGAKTVNVNRRCGYAWEKAAI